MKWISIGAALVVFAAMGDAHGQCKDGRCQAGSESGAAIDEDGTTPTTHDLFDAVNAIRHKRGLLPFAMDGKLMKRAQRTSMIRARRGIAGHLRGWQGEHATAEGCGARSGCDLGGENFITCCLFERWKHAGVGAAHFKGRTFYTLLVR